MLVCIQVSLNLDVEKMLPDLISRKFIQRQETVFPNKKKNICSKVFQDDNTLKRIGKAVIEKGYEVGRIRLHGNMGASDKLKIRSKLQGLRLVVHYGMKDTFTDDKKW